MPSVETQLSLTDAVMAQDLHSSSMSLSEILMEDEIVRHLSLIDAVMAQDLHSSSMSLSETLTEDEIVRQRVDGLEQMKKVFLAILTLLAGPRK